MDGDMADTGAEDIGEPAGVIQDMPGDTRDIGDQDGAIQVTGVAAITETTHTATDAEVLQLTMATEIIHQTELLLLIEIIPTEAILETEIISQTETAAILQTEITPTDQTVILTTEEIHL
mgnify:FL=1